MSLLRRSVLTLARSGRVKTMATTLPGSAGIVRRYVPGETTTAAVGAAAGLVGDGLTVTLDHLGEDVHDLAQAEDGVRAYTGLLEQLADRGLATRAEVSVKLSAIGGALGEDVAPQGGEQVARENARTICAAARAAGTTVTVDMEDHTTTDATLRVVQELRREYPETGAVLQAGLRRTEDDCRALAYAGSRVRLCKGAYDEPASVAYRSRLEVDRSYVRCLMVLMQGEGRPLVATHDPRLVRLATALAGRYGRRQGSYEFQMLYGIRPEEQRRLARTGEDVRVYVPYGAEWYGYLMRRLAERPQNLSLFLSSLISKT